MVLWLKICAFLFCFGSMFAKYEPTYTIVIYMAARNDLFPFAGRNIKQMQQIGSTKRSKVFIQFDTHKGNEKITKRFFVEKNNIVPIGESLSLDSGDMGSLIDCVKTAYELYPSDELILILWNHGTGPLEPDIIKSTNTSELFKYNSKTHLIELDRRLSFLDIMSTKGICFDDVTGNFLTNKNLQDALETISKDVLKNKKIAVLSCDACSMAHIDVFSSLKNSVQYFVASQEVELGTGYNYSIILEPFLSKSLLPASYAKHLVHMYKHTYSNITHDYTHSAIDLSQAHLLDANVNLVATQLMNGLELEKGNDIYQAIKKAKHRDYCTRFNEPTYIDLYHFYDNLMLCFKELKDIDLQWKTKTLNVISEGLALMRKMVIANVVGENLPFARGISIYFPDKLIHKSYLTNKFAIETQWLTFLTKFLDQKQNN